MSVKNFYQMKKKGPGRPRKSEATIKDIKRQTRRLFSAEEKIAQFKSESTTFNILSKQSYINYSLQIQLIKREFKLAEKTLNLQNEQTILYGKPNSQIEIDKNQCLLYFYNKDYRNCKRKTFILLKEGQGNSKLLQFLFYKTSLKLKHPISNTNKKYHPKLYAYLNNHFLKNKNENKVLKEMITDQNPKLLHWDLLLE